MPSCDCDASAVRISLLGPDLTHDHGVTDFLASVSRDVVEANETESISACDTLIARAIGTLANALTQSSELIGIRRGPSGSIFRIPE